MQVATAELERRMEAFQEACRSRGLARTHQRLVIYRALAGVVSHPSADELFVSVRREIPSMSLATVYKNLTTFLGEGLVRAVREGGVVRFDANLARHHHLVCRTCERVIDVMDPALDRVRLASAKAKGFVIDTHEVIFRGTCPECRAKARA